MRNFILLCLLLGLTAAPSNAQGRWKGLLRLKSKPPAQGKAKLSDINISYQLNQRMAQTFRQAEQALEAIPPNRRMIMGEPIQQVFKPGELNNPRLYDLPFLKNSRQMGKYLAARNNRLLLQEIRRMQQVWAQIDENLPRLRKEAAETEQPENQITWLADSIPERTTQLFIGERHDHSEIHQFVVELVQELRTRQPDRQILLFTEFLPENLKWTKRYERTLMVREELSQFFPIWNQIVQAQVPVIGLELPQAINDTCSVRYLRADGFLDKQTVWASLEAVRLRNERWQKTLATYRAQYPDALFIIYTGADHSLYNRPFTLATPGEQTFVSVLYPNRYAAYESSRFFSELVAKPMPGPLERLVDQLDFQRPAVKWQSPDLPAIAGFDVRIKIPVLLRGVDY